MTTDLAKTNSYDLLLQPLKMMLKTGKNHTRQARRLELAREPLPPRDRLSYALQPQRQHCIKLSDRYNTLWTTDISRPG